VGFRASLDSLKDRKIYCPAGSRMTNPRLHIPKLSHYRALAMPAVYRVVFYDNKFKDILGKAVPPTTGWCYHHGG
jgi:hypothetical protein